MKRYPVPFRIPTRILIKDGCRRRTADLCREFGARRVLLVSDVQLHGLGMVDELRGLIQASGLECELFTEVEANPRTSTVEKLAALAREGDVLVGLGGGSVLDAAKAASMLATNGGRVADHLGRSDFDSRPLPFIAIPTTCGTGSEVTWVAVITDQQAGRKVSLKGEMMFPTAALVDAELLQAAPASLVATTGMDALTHALEATSVLPSSPIADLLAEEAIVTLITELPHAFGGSGKRDEARRAVLRASTLAGLAFGNTDVGAVHCLSETLGGLYDVPHGLTNALLLAPVMRYHLPVIEGRLAQLNRRLGGEENAEAFLTRLEKLAEELEIPAFATLEIPRDAWPEIARRAVLNGSNDSNPQPMDSQDYLRVLESLE